MSDEIWFPSPARETPTSPSFVSERAYVGKAGSCKTSLVLHSVHASGAPEHINCPAFPICDHLRVLLSLSI